METLLVLLIFIPFFFSFLFHFTPKALEKLTLSFSLILMFITCLASPVLTFLDGQKLYYIGGWATGLAISLKNDGLASLFIFLTGFIFFFVGQYSLAYYRKSSTDKSFYWSLYFILWGSLNALYLSNDLFNIYVTIELVTISAVILIAYQKNAPSLVASLKYLIIALVGSMIYLFGVGVSYAVNGVLDLSLLSQTLSPHPLNTVSFILLSTGLMIKTALFPFHFWLPPAHSNASTPLSAILSGIVIKASFYLLIKIWINVYGNFSPQHFYNFIGFLAFLSIVWGSFHAYKHTDLKKIVAYSTVAQVGYLFILAPLLSLQMTDIAVKSATYQVISHALAKSAFFLAVGNIIYITGKRNLEALAGVRSYSQMSMMAIAFSSVSLIGLPPSGGFIAKWYMIQGFLKSGTFIWILLPTLGTIFSSIYLFRILAQIMRPYDDTTEDQKIRTIPLRLELIALFLASSSIASGLFAYYPFLLIEV